MTHLERIFWCFVGCMVSALFWFPAGVQSKAGQTWIECWRYWDGMSAMAKTKQCVPVLAKGLSK